MDHLKKTYQLIGVVIRGNMYIHVYIYRESIMGYRYVYFKWYITGDISMVVCFLWALQPSSFFVGNIDGIPGGKDTFWLG